MGVARTKTSYIRGGMFARRQKLKLHRRAREAVWPSMGYRRAFVYWRHRLFRGGDTAYKITAGLAVGAGVSFSPFLGTHVWQAFLLAWLLRASWLAAFIGTGIGNPATLPILFWIAWHTGITILGAFGYDDRFNATAHFSWHELIHNPLSLLLPLTIGGYICGAVAGTVIFAVLYYPVRTIAAHYRSRKKRP